MNTLRKSLGSNGTQTSALGYGGRTDAPANTAVCELWNGTNWTEVADLNTARSSVTGTGTDNTAAVAFGGNPAVTATELWNGSNWTEVNDLNSGRNGSSATGTSTVALGFGGDNPFSSNTNATESWNGTNWTNENAMNIARRQSAGSGSSTNALASGGYTTTYVASTEEWYGNGNLREIISTS